MTTSIKFLASASVLALALAGCTEGDQTDLDLGPEFYNSDLDQLEIYGGSPPNQEYHDATTSLHYRSGFTYYTYHCSSTFIFDRWFGTAAHCIDGFVPSTLAVNFGTNSNDTNYIYNATVVTKHASYNSQTLAYDIGVVGIGSTPTYTDPVMPLPYSIRLVFGDAGDTVNIAGFGLQENGFTDGILEQANVSLVNVGASTYGVNERGGRGFCFGDSGGPTFVTKNGYTYVAGAHSYVTANGQYDYCEDYGYDTAFYGYESWIESKTGEQIVEVGGGPTDTVVFNGSLNNGQKKGHKYSTNAAGTHQVSCTGTPADIDLFFLKYTGAGPYNGYAILESSETNLTSNESLSYTDGSGGDYVAGVWSQIGSGTYTITAIYPI